MNIKSHIPSRDCILIKLPDYTEKLLRKDEVLSISTLNQILYHPTKGEVIAISPTLKNKPLEIGDCVFFEKLHWEAAKEAAFDSTSERDKGIYFQQEVYAIHQDDTFYMVLPYRFLYMVKSLWMLPTGKVHSEFGKKIKQQIKIEMLNNYVLCEPVDKYSNFEITVQNGEYELKIADLREDEYALNQVKLLSPDRFAITTGGWGAIKGDILFCLPHCDIPLEEEINQSNPSKQFIIESQNIIAKLMGQKYIAAPNRIVIELIPQPEDEEQILKIDSEFANCQMAKVISAGTGVECKEGETIVFPRNAGRKNKLPILPNQTVQYEVIGKDDYFTTIKED